MTARVLRRFLYLDPELTDEYLAQAEGGLYDEEDLNRTSASGHISGHEANIDTLLREIDWGVEAVNDNMPCDPSKDVWSYD